MEKKLDDMTRRELLEMYEARGGKLSDFDKRYVNRSDLLGALEELDEVSESSASFAGDFEFVEEEEEKEIGDNGNMPVRSTHSDQWYEARGLPVPKE